MVQKQSEDYSVKTENLGIDIGLPERQSMQGYVPTFLNEHQMIMALICNPTISQSDRHYVASAAICTKVSLITDSRKREELWKWYEDTIKERFAKEPNANMERKNEIKFEVSMVLLGKVMDFVGLHISKPIEVGTE